MHKAICLLTFEKRHQVGIDHLCIRSWQASAANANFAWPRTN
jgi:hypothetical protein